MTNPSQPLRPLPDKTFNLLLALVSSRGGELPKGNQRDEAKRILVRCDKGHEWHAYSYNVLKGCWCPHPACCGPRISKGRAAKTLETQKKRIQVLVNERQGHWPKQIYKNNSTPLSLVCKNGHEFSMRPDAVLQGSWCPRCAGKVPASERLAELQQIAIKRGGELLSAEYKPKARLHWRCSVGHTWWSSSGSVRDQRSWCPYCAGCAPLDEAELFGRISTLAEQKGGGLIGLRRVSIRVGKKEWRAVMRCASNHEWEARVHHLLGGVWCPTCNMPGTREKVCRQILEHLLGAPFQKRRPDWLRTSKGRKAELDGYNEYLRLAFEYHGQQHYTHVPFFHSGGNSLAKRVEDDRLKREACQVRGITLLEVSINIPLAALQEYLVDQIAKLRPDLLSVLNAERFDIESARTGKENNLQENKDIARSRGGRCLSSTYVDNSTKMEWECSEGHRWFASTSSVKQGGSWCPQCSYKRISESKTTPIDEVESLCQSLNLCLHGTEKKANRLHYSVSCGKGHSWLTDLSRLKDGRGCQKCSARKAGDRLKLTLEQLQADAAARGARLLSQRYQRSGVRLLWECRTGHRWLANANSVRRGSWCPLCAGKTGSAFRGSVEEFLRSELEA